MKIYFAGSITGGREHADRYPAIVKALSELGEVVSVHVASTELSAEGEVGSEPSAVFNRDCAWVRSADIVVAEVTQPSLGVGYEIGLAERLGIPIIALFWKGSGKTLSRMISGNPAVTVISYTDVRDACERLREEIMDSCPLQRV